MAVRNDSGIDLVFTASAIHGLVPQEDFFTKRVASSNLATYLVVQPGDYVFNKSSSDGYPLGAVRRNLGSVAGVVSPLYVVMRQSSPDLVDGWLDLAVESPAYVSSLGNVLKEGGRAHGALNVTLEQYFSVLVPVPPKPVQRRIVDLVAALDRHSIALELEGRASAELLTAARSELLGNLESKVALADVLLKARAGGTPSRKEPSFFGGDIPWLKSGEVGNPRIVQSEESITQEGLKGSSAWLVPAGTPVVAMYGATAAAAGYLAVPMATNQAVLALVPDPDLADSRFLYHWMKYRSSDLKKAAAGAAQPNLSKEVVLRESTFPVVEVTDQVAIAATLDSVEDMVQRRKDELLALKLLRRATVASLLGGGSRIDVSYDELLEQVA